MSTHWCLVVGKAVLLSPIPILPMRLLNFWENLCLSCALSFTCFLPISSAGLLGLLLMNVSKDSFIRLMNLSFRWKHTSITWSTRSLKSSRSCTMSLSFSGLMTIVVPKVCKNTPSQQQGPDSAVFLLLSNNHDGLTNQSLPILNAKSFQKFHKFSPHSKN